MSDYQGRGAWSSKGGTLKWNTKKTQTVAGPYYMLSKDVNQTIGLKPYLLLRTNQAVDKNELAVYHGVIAIQVLLNYFLKETVAITGYFDTNTDSAVKKAQAKMGVTVNGTVGQTVMRKLLLPLIEAKSAENSVDWKIVYGLLKAEGAFDPGAVGYSDSNDLGLAQINSLSHPDMSFSDAFCPSYAITYVAKLLSERLQKYSVRDAVASYNLGPAGIKEWIELGRPDIWTPSWATTSRNTKQYIDNILNAYKEV